MNPDGTSGCGRVENPSITDVQGDVFVTPAFRKSLLDSPGSVESHEIGKRRSGADQDRRERQDTGRKHRPAYHRPSRQPPSLASSTR